MAWSLRICFELLSKLTHVDPQVLHVDRRSPDLLHDHPVGENAPCMEDKEAQNVPFLVRQLHLVTSNGDEAAREIDREIAVAEQGFAALLLPTVAQRRADACHKLGHTERLCHV